jgi:N-acetylmuramoyl-L-alanine amidase
VLALLLLAALPAPIRVYLDAGHGAFRNPGATNARCESEEDVTLRIAEHVAKRLDEKGGFKVRLSRRGGAKPSYPRRVADAVRFRADVFVSIHIDARGEGEMIGGCPRGEGHAGFAVLVNDPRVQLARSVAERLASRGFTAYDGEDYGGLYAFDETPGVFLDRRKLFVVRKPSMPSILIETHHGWNLGEVEKWNEAATLDAFADALAAALAPPT